jgi:hypothetical protein
LPPQSLHRQTAPATAGLNHPEVSALLDWFEGVHFNENWFQQPNEILVWSFRG